MSLSRRQFMSRGLLAAAGGLTIPMWAQWLAEKMERLQPRKYVRLADDSDFFTEAANTLFQGQKAAGLRPVPGQPGVFYDASTGKTLQFRDFSESDKWDTIEIPKRPRELDHLYADVRSAIPTHNAKITGIR